ncbi:MAG: amino acid adenylation domain-containing protein, partial [Gemmatimonadota bacterium]
PLSFAQQRLWFIDQLQPGSAAYNVPAALRLRGALDARTLRRALAAVVRRHEALRTVLPVRDGEPVQEIRPAGPLPFPVVELGALPPRRREAEAVRLAAAEAARPFDLARGPLLRATLLKLDRDDHAVLFTLHHVVSDAWSMEVLTREVSALYATYSRGEEHRLPELPVQYADYAAWQRGWLAGEALEAQLAWWRERLAGAPPVLEIPTDRPRRPLAEAPWRAVPVELPAGSSRALRELARREGATPFMALLAAWQLLLGRYAGEEDVVVGSPIAGRTRAELEGLIGFFVNTLVLRADLSGDAGFRGLLERVRETTLGAFQHQDLPFERLVEELQPERSLTHAPLFQVMFSLEAAAAAGPRLGDVRMEPLYGGGGVTQFDLDLDLEDGPERIRGVLRHRTDLFEAATAERMAGHFRVLLEGVLGDPDRPLAEISLLDGGERAQVVARWNATARPYPRELCLHELVSAQAARTPGAPAVLFEGRATTYAELEAGAGAVAERLRERGVGPETRVGICVEKGPGAALAVLGVLRAGGAYVPLDPAYPTGRLEYMLANSGAALVLAQPELADRFAGSGVEVVLLDGGSSSALPHSRTLAPSHSPSPENLAYVIYTSGSTGTPKGVAVPHRAVVNLATDMAERLGLRPDDRLLSFASLSFDVSVEEIFTAWVAGAAVVFSRAELFAPGALLEVVEREGVTSFELPTAYWHEWVRELSEGGRRVPECVRFVRVGGERISMERLREWAELRVPLVHAFGLTETACTSATLRLAAGDDGSRWGSLPIGRPTGNVRLYVLDRAGEPAPTGVPGELFVGGEGVARGYLGRPGPTAETFVPDALGGGTGERLYRTGDRVRWLSGGTLEFLGRIDHQVKVRGFRIEPAEVEAALVRHPAVAEAVVTVRGAALVAYYTADGEAPAAGELREHLRGMLPPYMVPGAYVALERLPLSPSGKVDRRALPAPAAEDGRRYAAARTETERALAEAWAEVLGRERVGVEDDFFELGGHSLLATRVVSRAREAFGVELPVRALFETPTVAGLAERVEALLREGAGSRTPPLVPVPRDGDEAPLSFAQQRLWFIDRLEPGSSAYNMPAALRLRGALEARALRASLGALVRRHETLRTVFALRDGEPVQVIRRPGPVPLPTVDLAALAPQRREAEAARLAAAEAARPFDLERGPLLRATLLRLDRDDHALLFTLHHVVGDAWSMEVLTREVSAAYGAYSRGEEPRLPELPVQYADYAAWQRGWLAGEALEAQLAWWRERLAGAPPVLEIPTDHPRRPGAGSAAGRARLALDPRTAHRVRELARREGATPFMALLAAWQLLLGRYAGQVDVVVGSPIAGRTRSELEGLIGFFVNTLVLRTDLSGDAGFRELLRRVREATLGAFQHQDLPFERLVEELQPERSLTHTPLFQVVFSLQGAPPGAPRLGRLEAEPLDAGAATATFDLSFTMTDTGEGLEGSLVYRTALFEAATAERMLGHFAVLLRGVAADPDQSIGEVDLLSPAERERVLVEWNATARDFPRGRCVHELIAEQAARTPDAVAVEAHDGRWTYAELEHRANRLARHLRSRGVGPEARVGLLLERGADTVAAVLGILRAGAAYLALDPSYPDERLRFMLEDAGATVLLTRSGLAERCRGFGGAAVLLDADREAIEREPAEAPEGGAGPEGLAYVIYTSGSTGAPKGVLVEHRALANYLAWFDREVLGEEGFALPMVSRLSFDAHARQLFPPLLRGEAAWVLPEAAAADPRALLEAISGRERVSFGGVPSLWGAMLELVKSGEAPRPAGLRAVLLGGEAFPPELAERTLAEFPGIALWNHYGPTEGTVNTTVARVRPGAPVTLGRPVANVRVYLLDGAGHPVPEGVPGELHVAGAGVARGYLGRPGLTAERFLPDPFSGEARSGARMYRSGDRARWRADGTLDYLGRVDQQVKVRGHRVEPGEVEAVLERHPAVREAAVAARDDRLAAYVAFEEREPPAPAELRGWLRERLPEHMVPASLTVLAELPRTPNGKLDRRALPGPEAPSGGEHVAPRSWTEEALAAIWSRVLGTERVGVHDDFFALGGHSLLATRVVSEVRATLGLEVPLRALFERPTVAGLAELVDEMSLHAAAGDDLSEEELRALEGMTDEEAVRLLGGGE